MAYAKAKIESFGCNGVPCDIKDIQQMIAEGYSAGATEALESQWVSVEDKLPEDDTRFYFVADASLNPLGVDCVEYTCETKKFSRYGKIIHPTHWMPIPEPPMKGGEA